MTLASWSTCSRACADACAIAYNLLVFFRVRRLWLVSIVAYGVFVHGVGIVGTVLQNDAFRGLIIFLYPESIDSPRYATYDPTGRSGAEQVAVQIESLTGASTPILLIREALFESDLVGTLISFAAILFMTARGEAAQLLGQAVLTKAKSFRRTLSKRGSSLKRLLSESSCA